MEPKLFVGVDGGRHQHQFCVVNQAGEEMLNKSVEHDGPALASMMDTIIAMAGGVENVQVGIEVPRGALVEGWLDRGVQVFSINPKQLSHFRERYSAAGAKDDRKDALVLAQSLRTDHRCYRRVKPDDPLVVQLRGMTHSHDGLIKTQVRLQLQLEELLYRFFPQILRLGELNQVWMLELLELVPTPQRAQRLKIGPVRALLKKHRVKRVNADRVLAELTKPAPTVAPGVTEASRAQISLLLPQLHVVREQIQRCDKQIDALLDQLEQQPEPESSSGQKREHRDVTILRSFAGAGNWIVATVLAEASQLLEARDYHTLRKFAGSAPVTRQSGKTKLVSMRYACNQKLRNALYHLARVNMQHDSRTRKRYSDAKARGKSHGHAIRIVGNWLLQVLVAMLKSNSLYRKELTPAAIVVAGAPAA